MKSMIRAVLALVHTSVLGVEPEDGWRRVVVSVRPHKRYGLRCPVCGKACEHYDTSPGPRRWRAMDLGLMKCYLQYTTRRVRCPEHGVHVEDVPWARPRARHTRDFEDWVAWLACFCNATTVKSLARVGWGTVGQIVERVVADMQSRRGAGRFDGLRRIGIDETSYKKGHRYITVVVDHDRGCLVWAHEGTGREVLGLFFDELTPEQRRGIEVVTADGAKWIKRLVRQRCKKAAIVMDPFHVVQWMTEALEEVRRSEWRVANAKAKAAIPKRDRAGRPKKGEETPAEARALKDLADDIKGTRWALLKNPDELTDSQRAKLRALRGRAGSRLFRAWELKEDLRAVFQAGSAEEAERLLDDWIRRASRCRIAPVVEVEKKVRARRKDIVAAVGLGVTNGRVEAINSKIKVTVKMAYGFRNVDNLLALVMLRCGELRPTLPGRDPEDDERRKRKARERAERKRAEKRAKKTGWEAVGAA